MTTETKSWVQHPGYYIREEMEERGWLQRDLAFILGVSEQSVTMILTGKRGISADMAKALGGAFDVSPEFFANLQKSYDLSKAAEPNPGIAFRARVQSCYPIREMIKRGWLEDTTPDLMKAQLAEFFEVEDGDEIPYLAHAAKKSKYEEAEIPPVQLAWLFRVRRIAKSVSAPAYSAERLRETLARLESLTVTPEEAGNVPGLLFECGVRYVLVEPLPQGGIDGVCLWIDAHSPVIGMSIRFDRIDNFWFVLRHEIEHVLCGHGQEEAILDSLEGQRASTESSIPIEERIANAAAAEFCVPQSTLESFIARNGSFFLDRDVTALARSIGRHAGIVAGQLQRRLNRYDLWRQLLVRVRQHVVPNAFSDGWGQIFPAQRYSFGSGRNSHDER